MSLKRLFYSLLLYLLLPLVILRLFWRSRKNPAYRQRISERLGFVRLPNKQAFIWLHAVSVGETIAAKPLIEALLERYPEYRFLVTTTTPTGSDQVKALFAERVSHLYFPYDLPDVVSRFINRIQPKILIVVETEIWPNLYAACRQKKIPLMIVNARLSNHSTQAYSRIRSLVAETLGNVNTLAVRSNADAERFEHLGARADQIEVVGNIKYDLELNEARILQGQHWHEQWGKERPVWVAASTHAGEDEIILDSYSNLLKQFADLILVLVPRHPERFDKVYSYCENLKVQGIVTLRHSGVSSYEDQPVNIILGDSMGEMQSWYASADVVFIGGSLFNSGGHNPLEATALGVPVLSGQSMFNFEDIVAELSTAGLFTICNNQQEIESNVDKFLTLEQKQAVKMKAEMFVQQHRGVAERLSQLVDNLL
jgi:3-deoxy-D-manno-octulosonic-acid transferase